MSDTTTVSMNSFTPDSAAWVIGATGGIGKSLVEALCLSPEFSRIVATGRTPPEFTHSKVQALALDLTDEKSIRQLASQALKYKPPSLVIVATGLLHDGDTMQPEKSWRSIDPDTMAKAFAVNCTGPALVIKHLLPKLSRGERGVLATLSARVGSISDNRLGGWYAYRSSKAALNMIIKTASVELARVNKTGVVMGLHPGTVDTALSAPFQANVPNGKLFDTGHTARQLLAVINAATVDDSGNVLDWRGHTVPA